MIRTRRLVLVAAILAALATGCRRRTVAPDGGAQSDVSPTEAITPAAVRIVYPAAPGSFVKLIEKAARCVVHIRTDLPVKDGPADWFPSATLPPRPGTEEWTTRVQRALGSGFVVDGQGYVVTNAHLIGDQPKRPLWVSLPGGTELEAVVIGRDTKTDLAVLKVTPPAGTELEAARLGSSSQLQLGEWVIALGNPFGLGHRASVGIVSATPRHEGPMAADGHWGYVQTDVPINAGNSGGPLVNTLGEVVGVATAVSEQGGGIGFALPIDVVKQVLPMLKREGKVVRAWVGMYIDRVPGELAARLELPDGQGALITSVVPSGPAVQAGLRKGDVVVSFDGKAIGDAAQLPWLSAAAGVGRALPVTVVRDGKKLTFTLRTQPMPE